MDQTTPPEAATQPASALPPEFRFYTRLDLQELTGQKARNLDELYSYIKIAPDSVIYHHTHDFLRQSLHRAPEPPNDFAYWVTTVLNERALGEKLASINTIEFLNIDALRDKIASVIEDALTKHRGPHTEAQGDQVFYFIKSVSFVIPTPYVVTTLEEFYDTMKKITINSIYFHMFEARLRLEKGNNDFSLWLATALGEKDLADRISKLDPYNYTIEGLRSRILQLIEQHLKGRRP
jgi:hypothetical protein